MPIFEVENSVDIWYISYQYLTCFPLVNTATTYKHIQIRRSQSRRLWGGVGDRGCTLHGTKIVHIWH